MTARLPEPLQRIVAHVGPRAPVQRMTTGRSGAGVWRIDAPAARLAVRCWPPAVTLPRVHQIEDFLRYLRDGGIDFVPAPRGLEGTLPAVDRRNRVWSAETWMEGGPVADEPIDTVRMDAVIGGVAALHQRARGLGIEQQVPLAVQRRSERLNQLPRSLTILQHRVSQPAALRQVLAAVRRYADEHLASLTAAYRGLEREPRPCWMVLRDLHRQHVLFEGEQLTGIVDFDAVRVDTPLADLARLLGSLLATDAERYREAIARYLFPERPQAWQLRLVDLLDEATTLCAAVYWLETLCEGDDRHGWQLLQWHVGRLHRFPFGWSGGATDRRLV